MPRGGQRDGAGRKGNWDGEEAVVVRIPARFKDKIKHLIELSERLDNVIAEIEPRKNSERVKLAWTILMKLRG